VKNQLARDDHFIPLSIKSQIIEKIILSLNSIKTIDGKFIVNDTLCFRKQGRGNKITPCVMNSASYMSSAFQHALSLLPGCRGETTCNNQSFDGMINLNFEGDGFKVADKDNLLKLVHEYIHLKKLKSHAVYTLFPMFYGMFVERSLFDISELPESLHHYFIKNMVKTEVKVGVEFETGNIASSFRSINKLYGLYQSKNIDIGVLVTSIDKPSSATRIWPVSNRNGSFQELAQRNFEEQVSLPLLGIGFSPDGFSKDAPFFDASGELYYISDSGVVSECGNFRKVFGKDSEEILIPLHL